MFMNNKCAGHCQVNSSKLHHHREVMWRGLNDQHQMQRPADSLHKHVHVCHCWDKNTPQNTLLKNSFSRSHFHQNHSSIFTERTDLYNFWHVRVRRYRNDTWTAGTHRLTDDVEHKTKHSHFYKLSFKMLIVKCLYKAEFMNL